MKKAIKGIKFIYMIFYFIFYRFKFRKKEKGIAQVVKSFNSGGLEQMAVNLYKIFKNEKIRSVIISEDSDLGPICSQVDSIYDVRAIDFDINDMIKYLAKNNIGTLVYHYSTFHMIIFKLLGFKNYYVIHNTYIWYEKKDWKILLRRLKFVDKIIAVSEWCKSYFEKKTNIKNIKVILNGIDFDKLEKGEKTKITRKKLGIKEKDVVCLTIGNYSSGKYQMGIIGIAEEVIKQNKNIKFISIGPILDKGLYSKMVSTLKKSKAKDNVILLSYIPQNEIGDFIYKNCDIYLQPSLYEAGVPLTVMEALIQGKPVIMTDFMVKETFPNTERIIPIKIPYDIFNIEPLVFYDSALEKRNKATKDFAKEILKLADNLDKYKDFNKNELQFLNIDRMSKEYFEYIKLKE